MTPVEVGGPRPVRIAHVVNPFRAPEGSDLVVAQPVAFAAIAAAIGVAADQGAAEVECYAVTHPQDHETAPDWMHRLSDLDRSILDLHDFERPRPLPLLADLLERTSEIEPRPDLIIYSNVDISPMPYFYAAVAATHLSGVDGMVINRRTITPRWTSPTDLPLMYAEIGDPHPGRDCFVFTPEALSRFDLDEAIIGAGDIGRILLWNIALHAKKFEWLRDQHLTFHLGDDRAWDDVTLFDYHEHNNDIGRRIMARLEMEHGPLRNREPWSLVPPRRAGYWAQWREWLENPPTRRQRAIGHVRGLVARGLRRVGLLPEHD